MIKRLAARWLLMFGLVVAALGFMVAPAGAQAVSPDYPATTTTTAPPPPPPIPQPSTAPATGSTSSTSDPCPVGNGTSNTTNPNCNVLPNQPAPTAKASTSPGGDSPTNPVLDAAPSPAVNTATALQAPSTRAGSSGLAFTGTDVIGTVIVAFLLIGGGIVVVRLSRKRHSS